MGGTVIGASNLSAEFHQLIRVGWMSLRRYMWELFHRLKASLLHLKARMVKSEVVAALLYGCATWSPLKGHYNKLRIAHYRMLLRILGASCMSPSNRILSYKDAPQRTECDSIKATVRTRRLLWLGVLLRLGDHRLPKRVISGELENAGQRGPEWKKK